MINKILYILLLSFVFGQQSNVGTTAAAFLGNGIGSKAMGMGGAFTSMIDDPSTLYWNPGAVSLSSQNQFQLSHVDWFIDTKWTYSAYIHKLENNNVVGINLIYFDLGEEEITTINDQDGTGDYWNAYDVSIGICYSKKLTDRFSFGIGGKYIRQVIDLASASGFALDLGLIYQTENNFRLGATISNIGSDMQMRGDGLIANCESNNSCYYDTDSWPLPIFYKLGISKDFIFNKNLSFTTSADWVIPIDDVEHINMGFELGFKDKFFVRSGFRQIGKNDTEESFTFGLGGNLFVVGKEIEINYTYQEYGLWGYMQYFEFIFNI